MVCGTPAQIYRACEKRGRIAYKRSGGSRFITHNDHWKSQIRHALYTGDRFVRCAHGRASLLPGARHLHSPAHHVPPLTANGIPYTWHVCWVILLACCLGGLLLPVLTRKRLAASVARPAERQRRVGNQNCS